MGTATAIAWTDHTFNPWWGCTKVSPACDHCYAETGAHRYGHDVWGKDAPRRFFGEGHWREALKWERAAVEDGRPALVFCASYCDVFERNLLHDEEMAKARHRLWQLIDDTPHLVWQLLTKRPENVGRMVPRAWWDDWPERVWVGTTVEDRQRAALRVPRLLRIPAPVRFVSMEPLLERVELADDWIAEPCPECSGTAAALDGQPCRRCDRGFGPTGFLEGLRWVIVGGESGPQRRRFSWEWARELRDRCDSMNVPFFFKQDAGAFSGSPGPDDLDSWKQFPEEANR